MIQNYNEYLNESEQLNESEMIVVNEAAQKIAEAIKNGEEVDRKIIVVKGDTDGNGKITPFESVKVINHYLEKAFLTGPYLEAGDTDNNKNITPFDSVKIINHYLEKSSLFN